MTQARAATATTGTVTPKPQLRPLPEKRYWLADVPTFPTENGYRYEIIDGELIVTPAPARPHAAMAVRLTLWLSQILSKQRPDWCLITQPFSLETETETTTYHCEPDLGVFDQPLEAFISDEALLPIIVIEIVSPGNPENDYVRKVNAYAAIGIPEYWIAIARLLFWN